MNKKIVAIVVAVVVGGLWGVTRLNALDKVEPGGIGRYQLASGSYGITVLLAANLVERTQNGLFRIDTETGEVQEYKLMLIAGGEQKSRWVPLVDSK